jgi:xylulokinase
MCLIGIDFGTTRCKVAAFSLDGKPLAIAIAPTPTHSDEYGTIWYPNEIWQVIRQLMRKVVSELNSTDDIMGISASSVGESIVLMDADGKCLYPIIAWHDTRTLEERDWWAKEFGEHRLREITGLPLDPIYVINKLMWIRKHAPGAFAKATRALIIADWITYKLCGAEVTNYSLASRTMAFNLKEKTWSEDILDAANIPKTIFGEAVPSSTYLGGVTPEVADELDLASGIPVFAGGHDHICASLGAGLVDTGSILNSTGTAETALTLVSSDSDIWSAPAAGLTIGAHIFGDVYNAMGTMRTSGACIEWAIRELLRVPPGTPPDTKYGRLMESLLRGQSAETGLLFFPLLRGSLIPENRPEAAGSFVGLRDTHTQADMMKAVVEGVSLESAYMINYLEDMTGVETKRIVAVGGGTQNSIWLQTKANILGTPIDVPSVGESAVLGAALLAGIGAGVYNNVADAGRVTGVAKTYVPNPEKHELFRQIYANYVAIRDYIIDI